ncbi:MFS transporter [Gordonia sp. 852002-50816_SCH5313054-c]|nr:MULTISPECIES: MFS transporter [unclassified Gordonia (in: high G+C Gram-positive bacteria)]OBC06804.1 MFS transporter [Gordonia sp. 852002-50395_SCH5434458]OBC13946.1 MFS transporter [Gordonia sp. 852002-50816_SCH5313054-c]OBC18671.1 MFS transporter [Gordonia sp. 852002-50816_SCH5313054-a]
MSTTTSVELTPRRKMAILGTCCMSLLIVSMDATIVNVALPAIRTDLNASVSSLQWVIDIYTLVLASLLMVSGATADRYGRKRLFQIGLVTFAIGSLACSLAPSVGVLIAARALQAVGGSMLNPVAMSIITQIFVDPRERARAIGVWGSVVGISMAAGPIVGGVLIDTIGWRAVFWINLPICLIAIVLTAILVPESRSPIMRTLDPVGQALAMIALGGAVYGLIEGPGHGWGSPRTVIVFAVAAAAFVGFVLWERRHDDPFIDLRFFGSVPFASATVIAICAFANWGGFLFLMSLYLQEDRGFSAVGTGAMLVPPAIAVLICSPLSGRAVGRWGTRPSLVIAGIALLISSSMMLFIDDATPVPLLAFMFFIFGLGFGMINAPITNSAVAGMPRHRAGAASAVASTSRQIGVSLGVALAGSVTGLAAAHTAIDFSSAMTAMWWIVIAFSAAILVLGIVSTTPWALRTAQTVSDRLIEPEMSHA